LRAHGICILLLRLLLWLLAINLLLCLLGVAVLLSVYLATYRTHGSSGAAINSPSTKPATCLPRCQWIVPVVLLVRVSVAFENSPVAKHVSRHWKRKRRKEKKRRKKIKKKKKRKS
jgi:hypothetical protein